MAIRLSGKDTSHKEVQLLKQLERNVSNNAGKTIDSSASQPLKQLPPILCTLSGIVTEAKNYNWKNIRSLYSARSSVS